MGLILPQMVLLKIWNVFVSKIHYIWYSQPKRVGNLKDQWNSALNETMQGYIYMHIHVSLYTALLVVSLNSRNENIGLGNYLVRKLGYFLSLRYCKLTHTYVGLYIVSTANNISRLDRNCGTGFTGKQM